MLIYMLVYMFLGLIGLLFATYPYYSALKKKVFLVGGFSALFILQALRADTVAADTSSYITIFNNIARTPWNLLESKFKYEYGYVFLNKIVSLFCSNPQAFLAIISFIIMFGTALFFYLESSNVYLSTLLFVGLNHFFTSMSSLRQYTALVLVMFAYYYIEQKKYSKSILFMFLAFFFHHTVIIFNIGLISLMVLKPTKRMVIFFTIIESLVLISYKPIITVFTYFFPKYNYYLTDAMINNETGIGEIRICFIIIQVFLVAIIFINKKYATDRNIRLSALVTIGITIGLLQKNVPYIWRLVFYFDYLLLLLLPEILKIRIKNKAVCISGCYILTTIYFVYLLFHNLGVIPYSIYF